MWLRPIEGSVAEELELADPFFTPDAYLNPKSYPTKIMFSEVTTTTTLSGSAFVVSGIGNHIVYVLLHLRREIITWRIL
jgi:hypothetical protein